MVICKCVSWRKFSYDPAWLRLSQSCGYAMKKRALGILLSTGPTTTNLSTAINLSTAALKADVDVYLYLIDEGVLAVEDPRFQPLRTAGLKLFACAYGAQQHGVGRNEEYATYCGLVILSNIVSTCDRFIALN